MNNSNWQARLDKLPSDEGGTAIERMHPTDRDKLKAFINSLLEEERQGLVSKIEESYHRVESASEKKGVKLDKGWNEAMKYVLSLLTKKE